MSGGNVRLGCLFHTDWGGYKCLPQINLASQISPLLSGIKNIQLISKQHNYLHETCQHQYIYDIYRNDSYSCSLGWWCSSFLLYTNSFGSLQALVGRISINRRRGKVLNTPRSKIKKWWYVYGYGKRLGLFPKIWKSCYTQKSWQERNNCLPWHNRRQQGRLGKPICKTRVFLYAADNFFINYITVLYCNEVLLTLQPSHVFTPKWMPLAMSPQTLHKTWPSAGCTVSGFSVKKTWTE